MIGKTYVMIDRDDAVRYERLCEATAEVQKQYVKVILRGRRDLEDFSRMLEVNAQLRDQLAIIDEQCKRLQQSFRGKSEE